MNARQYKKLFKQKIKTLNKNKTLTLTFDMDKIDLMTVGCFAKVIEKVHSNFMIIPNSMNLEEMSKSQLIEFQRVMNDNIERLKNGKG